MNSMFSKSKGWKTPNVCQEKYPQTPPKSRFHFAPSKNPDCALKASFEVFIDYLYLKLY